LHGFRAGASDHSEENRPTAYARFCRGTGKKKKKTDGDGVSAVSVGAFTATRMLLYLKMLVFCYAACRVGWGPGEADLFFSKLFIGCPIVFLPNVNFSLMGADR
jgi:hypothetical protein